MLYSDESKTLGEVLPIWSNELENGKHFSATISTSTGSYLLHGYCSLNGNVIGSCVMFDTGHSFTFYGSKNSTFGFSLDSINGNVFVASTSALNYISIGWEADSQNRYYLVFRIQGTIVAKIEQNTGL